MHSWFSFRQVAGRGQLWGGLLGSDGKGEGDHHREGSPHDLHSEVVYFPTLVQLSKAIPRSWQSLQSARGRLSSSPPRLEAPHTPSGSPPRSCPVWLASPSLSPSCPSPQSYPSSLGSRQATQTDVHSAVSFSVLMLWIRLTFDSLISFTGICIHAMCAAVFHFFSFYISTPHCILYNVVTVSALTP